MPSFRGGSSMRLFSPRSFWLYVGIADRPFRTSASRAVRCRKLLNVLRTRVLLRTRGSLEISSDYKYVAA